MILPVSRSVSLAAFNTAHIRRPARRVRVIRGGRGLRGLGCATGWQDQAGMENCTQYCNYAACNQSLATACNARNNLRSIAIQEIQEAYSDCFPDGATWSVDPVSGQWQVSVPPASPSREQACPNPWNPNCCGSSLCNPAAAAAPVYSTESGGTSNVPSSAGAVPVSAASAPAFSLSWSRAGSVFYPGDSWTVSVRGAAAGAQVAVQGGKNGASAANPLGVTDGSGAFQATGQISANDVGSWSETWTVGGVSVGQVSFTVTLAAAQSNAPAAATIGGGAAQSNAPAASTVTPAAAAPPSGFSLTGSTWIGGVPNWAVLGVGAVLALFMFRK